MEDKNMVKVKLFFDNGKKIRFVFPKEHLDKLEESFRGKSVLHLDYDDSKKVIYIDMRKVSSMIIK